jgi:hypothetical protein
MGKLKIYISGVSRERARELVLRHIDQDPSLESLRELYEVDLAKPELDIINVAGMTCVGVPMGTPEFVNAFVRSKAHDIVQGVHKLRIVPDPKIHYDLLRFFQHTRLAFLARNLPPDVLMRPADASFDPGRGDWRSGILQRSSAVPVPDLIQSSIVHAILQRGLGANFATLSAHELAWCCVIVELPHHKGGLGITPLPASGMAAFYSATAHQTRGTRENRRALCDNTNPSMQRDEMRRAAQPPTPGGWPAGSTSSSSPQGLETRSRKHARTHSASSPPADSNCTLGAVVDAQRDISHVTTDSYQGNTASAYRTWLQSIDQQTTGKPAYTSYIGAKVAQHFETGWGVGVVCCITADPRLRLMTRTPAPDTLRPTKSQPFSII